MIYWIIEDGAKVGPLQDYEIRSFIAEGRVKPETKVWHEGAEEWKAAGEVERLASAFELEIIQPPPLPVQQAPILLWQRAGARWFDFLLYELLILVVFRAGGRGYLPDPTEPQTGMMIILLLLPAILMESAFLNMLGFTPGKWLLGLRVTDREGQRLSLGATIIRSMRVWVLGMGMRNMLLIIFGHAVNLWIIKKKGAPLWDLTAGYQVQGRALETTELARFWLLFGAVLAAFIFLIWPEFWPAFQAEMERQSK